MPTKRVFRRVNGTVLSLLLCGSAGAPVFGQDVAVSSAPTGIVQESQPAAQTPAKPQVSAADLLPTDRVGVDKNRVMKLSLQEAVLMALRGNVDIEVERGNVQIAQFNATGAKGSFDPLLSSSLNFTSSVTPTASAFFAAAGGAFSQKQLVYNGSLSQSLQTGGNYSISFNNQRTTNTAGSTLLNPNYNSNLQLNFTQPLMRNLINNQSAYQLRLSQKRLNLSDSQFRQRVINTIAQVQAAYWDLVFAIRNAEITREAVELAAENLRLNQRQVEVGTLAPIEVVATKAELESRKDTAISALQQVTTAENALKALMLGDPGSDMWSAQLEPTERVEFSPFDISLDNAIDTALKNRPEIEQNHVSQELKKIDLDFFDNQKKPQLDFVTNFTLNGLAGTPPRPTTANSTVAATDPVQFKFVTPEVFAVPSSSTILPQQTTQPGNLINPQFIGGYGTALSNLFKFDFKSYSFGVNFSFPLRNRTAEANYGRTVAENRILQAQERQLRQTVSVDVRNAVQGVVSARQRVEAARAGRVAAETQLKGEEQRYAAGLSTNFFVLDRQNRLSTARGQEIRALTDYNKAITQLQRVMGTTLAVNNIQVTPSENGAPADATTPAQKK